VRDLYAGGAADPGRIQAIVDDAYLATLASAVAGGLGGKVGVAPRVFLRKLVGDVLDRVDQFRDFDPRRDYSLTINDGELSDAERQAASPDDIELDVAGP
jgi:hypothetical protein